MLIICLTLTLVRKLYLTLGFGLIGGHYFDTRFQTGKEYYATWLYILKAGSGRSLNLDLDEHWKLASKARQYN